MKRSFIIAIDGTSASGKSTLAKKLSEHFHCPRLDTGKIYRLLALQYYKDNESFDEEKALAVATNLSLGDIAKYQDELNSEFIAKNASFIAQFLSIRNALLDKQRQFAANNFAILDGRDIGSVVLPNADFKFFITANLETRAKRRYEELNGKNSYEEVLRAMQERDEFDINRIHSPLLVTKDAHIIDTSDLDIQQMLEEALNIIHVKSTLKQHQKELVE